MDECTQQRARIMSRIEALNYRTDEQHSFVESMNFIAAILWMSTDASTKALLEVFPPEVLINVACLKYPLLYRS